MAGYALLRHLPQAERKIKAGERVKRVAQSEFDAYSRSRDSYPTAADAKQVGQYPFEAKSGAGLRFDRVLEYRLWYRLNIENVGACCLTAATATEMLRILESFLKTLDWAKVKYVHPVVLVEQDWYLVESRTGTYRAEGSRYRRVDEKRQTEWQLPWLLTPVNVISSAAATATEAQAQTEVKA